MTLTGRLIIRDHATESHSATSRLCKITPNRVAGVGHMTSNGYRHVVDTKEAAGGLEKRKDTERDRDRFVEWYSHSLGKSKRIDAKWPGAAIF